MTAVAPAGALDRARTLLFVSAHDERRRQQAWASAADAVILDLEDGVAPSAKAQARDGMTAALATRPADPLTVVRINAPASPDGRADLEALAGWDVDAVLVPKADLGSIELLGACPVPVIALIETAAGVLEAPRIARAGPVARLMLGPVDLAAELGCDPGPDGAELLLARSQLVLASAAARLAAPIDGPMLAIGDDEALGAEARRARRLGYGAKACIHPAQLAEVARAFAPTADEIAWARRVVEAYEQAERRGLGVIALDGQMIDVPVARRARATLQRTDEDG